MLYLEEATECLRYVYGVQGPVHNYHESIDRYVHICELKYVDVSQMYSNVIRSI